MLNRISFIGYMLLLEYLIWILLSNLDISAYGISKSTNTYLYIIEFAILLSVNLRTYFNG